MIRSYHMISDLVGFHQLKDEIGSRSRMADAAIAIDSRLSEYLSRTAEAVQLRAKKPLKSGGRKLITDMRDKGERLLGLTILNHWNSTNRNRFLPDLCPWLIEQQVPLADKRGADGWGKIDLVGVSGKSEPVIIELKASGAADSPLRAIVEGIGYAVALRTNWNEYSGRLSLPPDMSWSTISTGSNIWVIVMAPEEFWQKLARSKVSSAAIPPLVQLENSLCKMGYPVRFSSIHASKDNLTVSSPKFWTISDGFWPA